MLPSSRIANPYQLQYFTTNRYVTPITTTYDGDQYYWLRGDNVSCSVELVLPLKSLNCSRFQFNCLSRLAMSYSSYRMMNIVKYKQLCSISRFEQHTATDLQSSVHSKSTDSKILSSGSLGDSFLAICAL
ncbi:hypothetical protein L2E82_12140 [Cichorium intybus]|uniref:Uncharacterized protein n=1 Tax=Cichorium intybus TaxID=13427 RepID=A0ACB9GF56_CICIN|nr:hypothetical protein L2E82_12140 [Cichorium intybus]